MYALVATTINMLLHIATYRSGYQQATKQFSAHLVVNRPPLLKVLLASTSTYILLVLLIVLLQGKYTCHTQ